jgi:hypothetical protein
MDRYMQGRWASLDTITYVGLDMHNATVCVTLC